MHEGSKTLQLEVSDDDMSRMSLTSDHTEFASIPASIDVPPSNEEVVFQDMVRVSFFSTIVAFSE